jgi:hypothetical protein
MRALIDPNIAMYLLERFPGVRRAGLPTMWACACAWVEEQVKPQYLTGNIPAVFESAAILRVQAICTADSPHAKQALLFAATELLSPYAAAN